MKITIKATNIELTEDLKSFVEEKINSLEKYIDGVLEAFVEVGKVTEHHQKGDFFRAEVDLRVPGEILRSEATAEDIQIAINRVKEELQRQIDTYRNKQQAKQRRGRRVINRELHLEPQAKFSREKKKGGRELDEGGLQ